ncbi:MAG: TIGR03545 family protein, partial [Colwellia sp.]|nr:TIGR03545 family protein [Colwellia sp.]
MNSAVANNKGIKKFIRFQGLLGFLAIMSLIIALLYIFAESLVKSAIEQGGGMLLGAEVNVASVELEYSPLILTVNGLEATDAEQPSHNMLSFKQASAGIDVWHYLLGKTIIEQLDIDSLEFMTKREKAGDVYRQKTLDDELNAQTEQSLLPSVNLQLPDVNALLHNDNLQTVRAAQNLQSGYKEENAKLAALKEKLPSKAKLKAYQVKVKSIGEMKVKNLADFNKVKAEFDALKVAFEADQARVKQAQEQLLASKERLSNQLTTLKNAPEKDWQTIEKEYQLDNVDTEDFAHILFGEKARGYYQKAETLYQRIAPMLSKSAAEQNGQVDRSAATGHFIHFDEANPLPEFLIKKATLSMVLSQGDFIVDAKELTHQHWLRGKPSELKFTSTNLLATGQMTINSQFSVEKSGDLVGNGQWLVKQLVLESIDLNETESLSLTLNKGELAGKGDFTFNQQKQRSHIGSNNHFILESAKYQGQASSTFANMLLDTFKALESLTLDVSLDGEIADPKLSLSSSLDSVLKGAFEKQIANKLNDFKGKVNTGLNDKLTQSLQMNSKDKVELINFETLLTDTDNALETLKNSDVVKEQQKKLQDKATDKL